MERKRIEPPDPSRKGVSIDENNLTSRVERRRYLEVAEEVLKSVAMGDLAVGDRLPDERTLAQRCGVSRSTVREALLVLEVGGVIEIRRGAGCYLVGNGIRSETRVSLPMDSLPRQLLEVRQLLEPSVAHLCALRITRRDLASLRGLLEEAHNETLQPSPDYADRFLRMGLAFHRELSHACKNAVLTTVVDQLVDVDRHPLWLLVDSIQVRDPAICTLQVEEHRQILDEIAAGNADAAAEAMAVHLGALSARIFGSGKTRPKVSRTRRTPFA